MNKMARPRLYVRKLKNTIKAPNQFTKTKLELIDKNIPLL